MSNSKKTMPSWVPFELIDKDFRRGTGALPIVLVVLAILCFVVGAVYTLLGNVIGIVSGCLLLAVAAIVKSIRSIEAYTIYMARVQRWMMHNACPSDCSPDAAPDKPVDSKPEIDSIQPSKPSDPSKFIN